MTVAIRHSRREPPRSPLASLAPLSQKGGLAPAMCAPAAPPPSQTPPLATLTAGACMVIAPCALGTGFCRAARHAAKTGFDRPCSKMIAIAYRALPTRTRQRRAVATATAMLASTCSKMAPALRVSRAFTAVPTTIAPRALCTALPSAWLVRLGAIVCACHPFTLVICPSTLQPSAFTSSPGTTARCNLALASAPALWVGFPEIRAVFLRVHRAPTPCLARSNPLRIACRAPSTPTRTPTKRFTSPCCRWRANAPHARPTHTPSVRAPCPAPALACRMAPDAKCAPRTSTLYPPPGRAMLAPRALNHQCRPLESTPACALAATSRAGKRSRRTKPCCASPALEATFQAIWGHPARRALGASAPL